MSRLLPAWLLLCLSLGVPQITKGDVCDSNPCENGGICLSGLADDFFSCDCPTGFTDPNCSSVVEVESDEEEPTSAGPCLPNPCHNGGTCEISEAYRGDTFIGYICKCPEGFNGIHCQHNVNECEAEPCKNGGICTDLIANYSCECPGEFMGRNCQYTGQGSAANTICRKQNPMRNIKQVYQERMQKKLESNIFAKINIYTMYNLKGK